ncbi:MAG TPA: sugar ABC transporter permease [Nocardioidaceae bacterium]|nr:sugar ABC transporter permease [Nocardioidaceae bacterium]
MTASAPPTRPPRRRRLRRLTTADRVILALLIGVPTALHLYLIWVPTVLSGILSFSSWDGLGSVSLIKWVGWQNYREIFTIYPDFWPAVHNNLLWLGFFLVVPTTIGLLLAYLLDKNLKGTRIYQSAIFVPVVLSSALVGFIWELVYKDPTGLLNNVIRSTVDSDFHRQWLSDTGNIWAVLVAASWRHIGYVMILFLAGLKAVDPALREAAELDGASEWQVFRHVVFPSLAPVNVVVVVVTIIESLRAFDIVFVINKGENGLELINVLIYQNVVGEASRIGYGSALAVILFLVTMLVILPYLYRTFRKDLPS